MQIVDCEIDCKLMNFLLLFFTYCYLHLACAMLESKDVSLTSCFNMINFALKQCLRELCVVAHRLNSLFDVLPMITSCN